ncbi:hypothetical protein ACH4Y0_34290 [Streptomyces sp. NPDC020707]|uniref:hypothetical protein n=1 Tax=Streptomyces sp. NPDC020707 TaxID=3365084 RepID=UPI003796F434
MGGYEGEFVVDLGASLCGRGGAPTRTASASATSPARSIRPEVDAVVYLRRLVRGGLLSGPNGQD